MTTVVYGASDDLVEVEGPIREEFYAPSGDGLVLAFSTGVVLRVAFSPDGFWRIAPLAGGDKVTIVQATDVEDDYSDRATLHDEPTWVVSGAEWRSVR